MFRELLNNKTFILHWGSTAIFQIGSFFTLVGIPWLALELTNNDPIISATVLAIMSLPHGFFVLYGGVLSDQYSPIKILFFSRLIFFVIMMCFSIIVFLSFIPLWIIYFFAFLAGLFSAIGYPAVQSILPNILKKNSLTLGNSIVISTSQITQIIGPMMAGWLIWLGNNIFDSSNNGFSNGAFAMAFFIDSIAALLSVVLISKIDFKFKCITQKETKKNFLTGASFCWQDRGIRLVLFYLLAVSFFLHGPLLVILPIYTKSFLGLSSGVYGSLYALVGIGTLIGAAIAVKNRTNIKRLGMVVLGCDLISGVCFVFIGFFHHLVVTSICLLFIGICTGVIMVAGTTWFQTRAPDALIGRVMGMLMFAVIGLVPISASLAGILSDIFSVTSVFIIFGLFVVMLSTLGLTNPLTRNMGNSPPLDNRQLAQLLAS